MGVITRKPGTGDSALGYADDDLLISPADPVSLPGPHPSGPSLATHPSILDFNQILGGSGTWQGHRYWLAYTPYPGTSNENPCIAYSDDGLTWLLPAGAPNPVVPAPPAPLDYNNDTELKWISETGKLRMYYRVARNSPATQEWWYTESADGATWSAPVKFLDSAIAGQDNGVSMAVVRVSTSVWHHYYINYDNTLRLRISPDGINCGAEQNLGNPWTTWMPWHIGVTRGASGRFHLLAAAWPPGKTLADADLSIVYAYSDNGVSGWVAEETPQLQAGASWASEYLYRPTFLIDDEATLKVRVWYGARNTNDTGQQWYIGLAQGRLRVAPRTLSAASKSGMRARVVGGVSGIFSRISAGLITAQHVISGRVTARNGADVPRVVWEDTRNNQVRPGQKWGIKHIAASTGVGGGTQDLLIMEWYNPTSTLWEEVQRWNITSKAITVPTASNYQLLGLKDITATGTVQGASVTATGTTQGLTARAKGINPRVEIDDDQPSQTKDGSKAGLRYAAATTGGAHDTLLVELYDPTTPAWNEFIRFDFTSKSFTFAAGKVSASGIYEWRGDILSANGAIKIYESDSSANHARIQMAVGSLYISPMLADKTLAGPKLQWIVTGTTTTNTWAMSDIGQLTFKPIAASAAANTTVFVDLADNALKFKDSVGSVAPVRTAQSGTTAARPTTGLFMGMQYFDTTLGKPVFLKTVAPAAWVDATGAVV